VEGAGAGLGEGPAVELLEDVVGAAQGAEVTRTPLLGLALLA
jgi:hypothetical protein